MLGFTLLLISLFFDGVLALKEKLVHHDIKYRKAEFEYDESRLSWDYMYIFSLYSLIFTLFGLGN